MIPVHQDNSSALYKSRELSRNQDSFCSTWRWDAWPALFIIHGLHAPDTRSSSWFYSGVALGEEVCFGTPIHGVQAVCVTNITPAAQTCTLSVSVEVKFHCTFRSGDHGSCNYLVLSQGFAITRAWYSVLRDTTKPAYHSKNPWQQSYVVRPNASLYPKAWCCNFLSSIAQEHLPWSIFHAALSLFFLWANHDTSEPLTYSVLP